MTDIIESKVSNGQLKLVEELKLFREHEQTFGTQLARETAKTSQSIDGTQKSGESCVGLALQTYKSLRFVQILSQTAASSGCEQNWSVF